jgi:excisionase family DNA binding protein
MQINENEVYTPKEAQALLKVSPSTMTRMIKKGLIRTARVGKQYRILGKELLRIISPVLEDKVGKAYNKARQWIHEGIDSPSSGSRPGLASRHEEKE